MELDKLLEKGDAMDRPVSHLVDSIIRVVGIRNPSKNHRKIINTMIRLLYYSSNYNESSRTCPLSPTELKVLYIYYNNPKRVTDILSISDRTLRNRMLKIRNKLEVANNIEAIRLARENNWWLKEEETHVSEEEQPEISL